MFDKITAPLSLSVYENEMKPEVLLLRLLSIEVQSNLLNFN